ncbi:hypothetical protein MKW94_015946 [Papaver nudicaule]|uniref:NHL repeat-containing protein n=1 Tax=Papaver nudicaule TaxID=74823 RepID=A0AA41V2I0_PAPNU|nr:hypothetical protein [Papaver nudicaule]
MGKHGVALAFISMVLIAGFSSVAAEAPAIIVSRFVSTALSPLVKWLWSLKSSHTKTAVSGRSMMKFESGYNVETVFDGSKLGIEPHSVEVLPTGEVLVLDSANSNLYKISQPLSRYSRPKLIAGSADGYSGHVDGKPRDARMSHPKGLTVDDRGNIYIADTTNMVIRKISDTGVTTIAGGNWGRGGGHVDGPSEDAKFSTDFDVFYVGSSCSLLVIDRANQAIREIQLQDDDCANEYETDFPLGVVVLAAAVFFGYMLALLQRRVGSLFYAQRDPTSFRKANFAARHYENSLKPSVRPPLIPTDYEENQEEGFLGSTWRLVSVTGAVISEILGGMFSFRKKAAVNFQQEQYYFQQKQNLQNQWPLQESFVIPDEDEPPPSLEVRTPRKSYPFMAKDTEKHNPYRQGRGHPYSGWNDEFHSQQHEQHQLQQKLQHKQQQQKHHRHQQQHYPSGPQTIYEQSSETTKEIVFGAVQEESGRHEAVVIKAVDYGNVMYNNHNIHSRMNYMSYNNNGY